LSDEWIAVKYEVKPIMIIAKPAKKRMISSLFNLKLFGLIAIRNVIVLIV